jgi:hypothetical protein
LGRAAVQEALPLAHPPGQVGHQEDREEAMKMNVSPLNDEHCFEIMFPDHVIDGKSVAVWIWAKDNPKEVRICATDNDSWGEEINMSNAEKEAFYDMVVKAYPDRFINARLTWRKP